MKSFEMGLDRSLPPLLVVISEVLGRIRTVCPLDYLGGGTALQCLRSLTPNVMKTGESCNANRTLASWNLYMDAFCFFN